MQRGLNVVSFTPGEELTIALIKPEGLKEFHLMIMRIHKAGLRILTRRDFVWNEEVTDTTLRKLYPAASEPMLAAAKKHLAGHLTPVLLIRGIQAIEKLRQQAGKHADPGKCRPYNLRHLFLNAGSIPFEGGEYFKNGIHRCSTEEEVARLFKVFFEFDSEPA